MSRILRVSGLLLPLPGANIDTDRIIPARFLRTVSFEGLERHVFEDDRAASASRGEIHSFDDPRFAAASVLVVDANFGCGSSREHAPQALYRRGIRAVIGESFSEIFFGNAVMLGMPCVTASAADVSALQEAAAAAPGVAADVDLERARCEWRTAEGAARHAPITMPATAREALVTGAWNATAALLSDPAAIDRVADRLPYLSNFSAG